MGRVAWHTVCLWPLGLQHNSPPCPSPTPGVHSNSCPLSRWCHPTISSSFIPFSHLQSFPASGSFQMSQFFASDGQSIGASASASVLPMNIQDWFPLGWTAWISLQSKGLSRVFSNTAVQKHHFSVLRVFFIVQLSHPYMTTGKTIALTGPKTILVSFHSIPNISIFSNLWFLLWFMGYLKAYYLLSKHLWIFKMLCLLLISTLTHLK